MDKVYLILGASSDLGCQLIRELAQDTKEEITLIAHYNSSNENLVEIDNEFTNLTMHMLQADLSDLEQTNQMIEKVASLGLTPTHIASFSASAYRFTRLSQADVQRMDKDMTIQVYSLINVLKAFVPEMAKQNYGKIVLMLSSATKGVPPKNTIEYTTVKYALLGAMKSIAADYGDQGININAVSPAMIETKFVKSIGRKIKEFSAEASPRHRNLNVEDVIPTVKLLLSDQSEFMNGTNINLSGIPE